MITATGSQLGAQIAEVMGLELNKVKLLTIVCEPGKVAVVHVELLLSKEQADAIVDHVKSYTLTE